MSTGAEKEAPAQAASLPAATAPAKPAAEVVEEFPDPDEDDLDDLDGAKHPLRADRSSNADLSIRHA